MQQHDVFLNAGDFFFRAPRVAEPIQACVRTLLGSCVSIVLWNSRNQAGGMSHSVLPARTTTLGALDANHCEGATALFLRELERSRTTPSDYAVYLVGGARMSMGLRNADKVSVGERNIDACRTLLLRAGFSIAAEHVGRSGPRRLTLQMASGRIEVLHENRITVLNGGVG